MKKALRTLKKPIVKHGNNLTVIERTIIINRAYKAVSHVSPDKQTIIVENLLRSKKS